MGTQSQPVQVKRVTALLHPAELELLEYIRKLGFGQIDKLEVQNGLPVMAREIHKTIRFGTK